MKPSYWRWLFGTRENERGILRFADRWMFLHIAVGLLLGWFVWKSLEDIANLVLMPMAGVFLGITFAWAGNAQALLQEQEVELVAGKREGGVREYVYVYQTAVLAILSCLCLWAIAGSGLFEAKSILIRRPLVVLTKSVCFASFSIAIRESWHVVLGAHTFLLWKHEVRRKQTQERLKQRDSNDLETPHPRA